MDAKLERSVVIQGFMIANHEVQKSGKGFGKAYWGNKWRFKIFDGFYTHPKDPATGKVVDVVLRFYHLMQRLEAASKGEDTWLNKQFETDEEMKKEVTHLLPSSTLMSRLFLRFGYAQAYLVYTVPSTWVK